MSIIIHSLLGLWATVPFNMQYFWESRLEFTMYSFKQLLLSILGVTGIETLQRVEQLLPRPISPDPSWWNSWLASDIFSWGGEDNQMTLRLRGSKSRAIWRCWGGPNKVPICDRKDIDPKDVTSEQKKSLQGHKAEEPSRRKERCVQEQGSVKCHCMPREQQAIQR